MENVLIVEDTKSVKNQLGMNELLDSVETTNVSRKMIQPLTSDRPVAELSFNTCATSIQASAVICGE